MVEPETEAEYAAKQRMKPEIKEMWITALTDGSYKKCEGALIRENEDAKEGDNFPYRHCALGVLEDLYRKSQGKDYPKLLSRFGSDNALLSPGCVKWAGLPALDPLIDKCDSDRTVSSLNDSPKSTFKQIATKIKKYF